MKDKDQILLENLCTKIFQESYKKDWELLKKMSSEELVSFLKKQGMNSRDIADIKNKVIKYRNTKVNPFHTEFNSRSGKIFNVKQSTESIRNNPKTMEDILAYVQMLKTKYNK